MLITWLLNNAIKPETLNWEEVIAFGNRTYYCCEDITLPLLAVAIDEEDIGKCFVYPHRFISLDYREDRLRVMIPIEDVRGRNRGIDRKYWLDGCIEEAFWLSDSLKIPISVEAGNVRANFAVNAIWNQSSFEEQQRIHALRQNAHKGSDAAKADEGEAQAAYALELYGED